MADTDKLVEQLSGLTVLEIAGLVKQLEEKWGVSAAAPVAAAAGPAGGPGGGAAAAPAEEKTTFEVVLTEMGSNKITVIKEVRGSVAGLGHYLGWPLRCLTLGLVIMSERIYFGNIKEGIEPPNLIEVQLNSYVDFLQKDVPFSKRKNHGLQAVFKEVFPIESYDEKAVLDFSRYDIGEPKLTALEAQREGQTYSAPLHVTFQLREEKGTKEEKVYMGEIPLMTPQDTFVINGAERVVVSQLHRSPGIAFESSIHVNGKVLYSFRIIPDRGSWIEVQFDTSNLLYIYLELCKF